MNKVYPLPLSPTYVRHWGVVEAVRELIQNGIDSAADFEYAIIDEFDGEHTLVLRSRGVTLDPSTLVLGVTSKAEDAGKIGAFGEGYKIALLVLTRLHKAVLVRNGCVNWKPEFRESETFGTQLLHIVESPFETDERNLEFRIDGLSTEELEAIVASCLLMQPPVDDAIEAPQGRILPSHPGRLYVGGLFICETDLRFGYDVKPQHIQLERDRQTVSDWDLKNLTRDMWLASGLDDYVAELIEDECPDLAYIQYGGDAERVAEACYRRFTEANPGAVPVQNQAEWDRVWSAAPHFSIPAHRPVIVGSSYLSAIARSASYRSNIVPVISPPTPQQELQAFLSANRRRMQRLPRRAMLELIERAKGWRVA